MAKEKDNDKDLEGAFIKRSKTLRSFYHAESEQLSESEQSSLTPILNSLKQCVSRYEEITEIAVGGEKQITKAHDNLLNRHVALAFSVRAKNNLDQEQFLREARLTANLAHPNIMPVYNIGIDEKRGPFFSMELVPGDSLKTIISKLKEGDEEYKRNYPLKVLLNIFLKICDAISYAHSRNVLHLDIKPDNIRVGDFGEVFVCDWGLARILNNKESSPTKEEDDQLDADILNDMTLCGTMKGTPGFMAPEQIELDGTKSYQTDIYALGALLYMLLTYKLPVRGSSANEIIENTKKGHIISPIGRLKSDWQIPNSLAMVAMKALSFNPEKRYKTVRALRKDIDSYLAGYPTKAERASWITRLTLLVKRHNQITFVILFFLLLLSAVIAKYIITIEHEKADAILAKNRAEESFALFLNEQKRSSELGKNLDQALLYTVQTRDFINAPSMIHVLETGLRKNMDPAQKQNLLKQKGILHFVLQEFSAAVNCFENAGDLQEVARLKTLSKKYAVQKPTDSVRLTDRQLAALINESNKADTMTILYLYYHHMKRRSATASPEQYTPLALAILDKINKTHFFTEKHLSRLKQSSSGYELDLSKAPYSIYSLNIAGVYRRNILQPLNLSSLNISYSKLTNPQELQGLKLDHLYMYGIHFRNKKQFVKQLFRMQTRYVGLTKKYYPKPLLNELKKIMTVDEQ